MRAYPQTPLRQATLPAQKFPSQQGWPTAPQMAQVPLPPPEVSQVVLGAEQKRPPPLAAAQQAWPAAPQPPQDWLVPQVPAPHVAPDATHRFPLQQPPPLQLSPPQQGSPAAPQAAQVSPMQATSLPRQA